EKEWARLAAEREIMGERTVYENGLEVSVFFQGVSNPLSLKKRYKDLIKIFHPDNLSGDKEMIQRINREYESLKSSYEGFKQA
ncbi:MAG: J domain-containing protein, partial [Lachnospiraceae bacterium]|nr:J domain-containing protein [Lachnospiraceae bacterium]